MNLPDINVIDKLRKENIDQFFTLVRMHLSFVVDINTDDVDCSTDKPKPFRWNFHKKSKSCGANSSQNTNNKPVAYDVNTGTEDGMERAYELIDFLSKEDNVIQEGIFRRTGSLSRQQELRQLLLSGSLLNLDEGKFSVHDCASVLKGFLAELPQPLLMDQYYQTYCTLAVQYPPNQEASASKLLLALQLLLLLLTPLHRSFLERLLKLLRKAADNEASNRMSPDTLATMFTPHLLCPRKLSPEAFHADSIALAPLISFMIRHSEPLFEAPARLITDVAAYYTIRERKRIMSPDIDLDESISDRTAANTIYTFVDRHRTNVENETNPTDTALAQLYAHIQALPDSQHKRRLIKQFNRQNGYGTPIQVQRTGKIAGSRSFGDSIKRHIFNKGLLNKTPKKGPAIVITTVEEKMSGKEKLHNLNKIELPKSRSNKASSESLNDDDSDASNESTLSDGALNRSKKLSPKFVSEPNLSVLDARNDETPKNTKKSSKRLFRSKMLSQNINKRYQKRTVIRGTPTSCVSCVDEQNTASENEISDSQDVTPKKLFSNVDCVDLELAKIHYITSTPGVAEAIDLDDLSTPYSVNFRRASMSPITMSTQKLSKAMQESIMTPRSRKPLIITSEQRDSLPESEQNIANTSQTQITNQKSETSRITETSKTSDVLESLSPNNDSDFISSEDDVSRSQYSIDKNNSNRSENTHFIVKHKQDLNTTLVGDELLVTKLNVSNDMSEKISLSEPFKEYLYSRSVLTASPVDLSILNKSNDVIDEKISDSLLYCLDGNYPSDLTSSISNLAVDKNISGNIEIIRSPFKNINSFANIDKSKSPNRKRAATSKDEGSEAEPKKTIIDKENFGCDTFQLRETEL